MGTRELEVELTATLDRAAVAGGIQFHHDAGRFHARISTRGFCFRGDGADCGEAASRALAQHDDHYARLEREARAILASGRWLPPGYGEA